MTLAYATHRLSGIASPANASYSAAELAFQLKSSGSKALFTCVPLLQIALEAAKTAGIPEERIYILEMPKEFSGDRVPPFKTVGDLILGGKQLTSIEELKWEKGQGRRQTAYLCYSSGTSGLPVSHHLRFHENHSYVQTERGHDLALQCNLKRSSDQHLRSTNSQAWANRCSARSPTTESHLWPGSNGTCEHTPRRWCNYTSEV